MYGVVFPVPLRVVVPVSPVYTVTRTSTADQQSYSFTSTSFSAAATDRIIATFVTDYNGGGLGSTAVTIGGVTATRANSTTAADQVVGAWFYALVPTGTSGTIAITFNSSGFVCGAHVYAIYNADPATITSYVQAVINTSTSSTSQTGIVVPPGGAVLAGFSGGDGLGNLTFTGVTEDADQLIDNDIRTGCGSTTSESGDASKTVSVSYSSDPGDKILSCLVFGPK